MSVLYKGAAGDFGSLPDAAASTLLSRSGGQGLYFLSETDHVSPTLAAQWKAVQKAFPQAKLIQWEPVNQDSSRAASKAAFGSYTDAQYKLENADVIVSLDADFLGGIAHPGFLPMAAAYAERHRFDAEDPGKPMNRLYVVETMPTVTGLKAEHRLGLKPSESRGVCHRARQRQRRQLLESRPSRISPRSWLRTSRRPGGRASSSPASRPRRPCTRPPTSSTSSLGAVGKTVVYTETVNPIPSEQGATSKPSSPTCSRARCSGWWCSGSTPSTPLLPTLISQPLYNNVPVSVHLGNLLDETGAISTWHIQSGALSRELVGRPHLRRHRLHHPADDRAALQRPLSAHDVLQGLLDNPQASAYDVVRANAKTYLKGDYETAWRKALHDGWVEGSAFSPKAGGPGAGGALTPTVSSNGGLEISFRPDPSLYDGRFANVGWLQELPKQVTSLSWDNAALLSYDTMQKFGIQENEAIELELNGRKVVAPVLGVPGHPDDAITVHLGFGRSAAGRVGSGVGFNAYTLRTSDAPLVASGAKIKRGKGTYDLCVTKVHSIEHRGAVRPARSGAPGIRQVRHLLAAWPRGAGARHHSLHQRGGGPQGSELRT